MDREQTRNRIRELLTGLHLFATDEQMRDGSKFHEDLGMDSLDSVELILAVEQEFAIDIPDEDAAKLETVGALLDYLEENC